MQIWVHFMGGVGGDGFANLLTHSPEVFDYDAHDVNRGKWRFDRIVSDRLKFFFPVITTDELFSRSKPFTKQDLLTPLYVAAVNKGYSVVCATHDISMQSLYQSDYQDILLKDRVNVLLVGNSELVHDNFCIKNSCSYAGITDRNEAIDSIQQLQQAAVSSGKYDYILDIDCIRADWCEFSSFCGKIGITVPKHQYDFYCEVSKSPNPKQVLADYGLLDIKSTETNADGGCTYFLNTQ